MDSLTASEAARRLEDASALEDDLLDELDRGDALEKYREQRMAELKAQASKLEEMKTNAHGVYSELKEEKDFLHITTKTPFVVVHFHHADFRRCLIMDKHLTTLAAKHFSTKFVKIDVETAPFFVAKLKVQVLPCVICFIDGAAVDRVVGFEELGGKDDFSTAALEKRLAKSGVIAVDSHNTMVKPKSAGKGITDSSVSSQDS